MIRNLVLTCCAILGLIVAAVGLGESDSCADLTYVNPSGIHTLDPARMSWTQDFRVAINLWEGLTTLDPLTLEPTAGAAYFPPQVSEDGLSWTFHIRAHARWSNGDPVTAADFVRGWRRAIEPGTATDYAFLLTDHIEGAADYVRWRQGAVAALSTIRAVEAGEEIDSHSAEALLAHEILQRVLKKRGVRLPTADKATRPSLLAVLQDLNTDWPALRERLLTDHARQLDERFAQVGVRVPDEKTLVVELSRPCPYFLDLTALPVFLPCHASIDLLSLGHQSLPITAEGLTVYDPQWTKPDYTLKGYRGLVTNGAYRLAEWEFRRRARLTANPFYHNSTEVNCQTVDMLEYANVSASLMAYERGTVDFLTDLNVPYDHELFRLQQTGKRRDFHLCDVSATYFLNFNCASERIDGRLNPFLNPLVRKAFTLATDRKSIVQNVIARGDRVAHSFVPPGLDVEYVSPEGLPYSPELARVALAEAGYAGGQRMGPVELLCTFNDERTAQALARMWEDALGVPVEIRVQESKTFAEAKARHHFTIARGNWYADYGDPTTFMNCLRTGNGNNDTGYSSARYDGILRQADSTTNRGSRMTLLRQAEAIILQEDCPILPILHYTQMVAISPKIRGLHPNGRLWFPFRFAVIER